MAVDELRPGPLRPGNQEDVRITLELMRQKINELVREVNRIADFMNI